MRLSINSDDPGYKAWRAINRAGAAALVTVNGVYVHQCFTADTKRGIAVVVDRDAQGKMQITAKHGKVKRKVLAGKVAIEFVRKSC